MTRSGAASGPLPARDAYRLWAPTYDGENAVTTLEAAAVCQVSPALRGRSLLDAACGTARRLPPPRAGARVAVGVDLVPEMLAARSRGSGTDGPLLIAGDVCALPLRNAAFDLVWCRLALGHMPDPAPAYAELARVAAPGAVLIVTDFHPAAVAAGHTRTFRDGTGALHAVEHYAHAAAEQCGVAARHGWRQVRRQDITVNEDVRPFYERAGALDSYHAQLATPLVLLLAFIRS